MPADAMPRCYVSRQESMRSVENRPSNVERLPTRASSRRRDELEFLPAALEIVETPAPPAGRAIGALLILFFAIAVVWAVFARIDIIASATGKIVPGGRTKIIQPIETSVVHAIRVQDGQEVKAGQVLVELDSTIDAAARNRFGKELLITRMTIARLEAAVSDRPDPVTAFVPSAGASKTEIGLQLLLLVNQIAEQRAKLAGLDDQILQNEGNSAAVAAEVQKLLLAMPLLQKRVEAFQELVQKGFGQKIQYLQQAQDLVEHRQELIAQKAKLVEAEHAVAALKRKRQETEAEFRRTNLAELVDAERNAAGLQGQLIEAAEKYRRQTLTAPVDGTVQQLSVHTIGGVVTPAQQLMEIVPADSHLEIEASVSNQDIGFVHPGQPAEIKVETFNFTKYGLLHGKVMSVSRDAIVRKKSATHSDAEQYRGEQSSEPQDEESIYTARVSLDRTDIQIGDKRVDLGPGMAVTVEIKTGTRRVIEYLLSPLLRYQQSAMRER